MRLKRQDSSGTIYGNISNQQPSERRSYGIYQARDSEARNGQHGQVR